MTKSIFAAVVIFVAATVVGCGGNAIFTDVSRIVDDPEVACPFVASFVSESEIRVSWDRDPRADEYILELSSGRIPSIFSIAYRGNNTKFTLSQCDDQALYLFRLTKMRGDKSFGPSKSALGVGSSARRDPYEPNDQESDAVELGFYKGANLFYYRAYDGAEVRDYDWYSITVPPQMIAYIVVRQTEPEIAERGDTRLLLYRPGQLETRVKNSVEIPLRNDEFEPIRIAFRIAPFVEEFVSGLGIEGGGSMTEYSITLYSVMRP